MPSANGVYTLPVGYLAVTGTTIQASQHNPPLEDIAAALTARLSRDGTAAMTGALQAAAGSAGAPSLTFATSNSTGFFKTTNGIGVAVGGTQVAEFLSGGINGARFIGELIPYTCTAAPALTVLPFGQTLSRTAYAALWAQAQIEIAAGNTFYNNGDGSTTFGIGDMRGRLPIGWDKMGGSASGRLTSAAGGVDGTTMGTAGGGQTKTLITTNLPPYTPSGGVTTTIITGGSDIGQAVQGTGGPVNIGGTGSGGTLVSISASSSFSGNAQGGTSTPLSVIPPVTVTNYLLYVGA
jgi:microcystin-dependent protein